MALSTFGKNPNTEVVQTTVGINREQRELLEEHNINRSQLFRRFLDEVAIQIEEKESLDDIEEITITL